MPQLPDPRGDPGSVALLGGRCCLDKGIGASRFAAAASSPEATGWLDRLERLTEDDAAPNRMRNRPSKNRSKRNAHWSQDVAKRLSNLSEKQLSLVTSWGFLDEYIVDEVRISSRIDGKNQGRRRQEALVAKLLRNHPGLDLQELEEAIDNAMGGYGPTVTTPEVEAVALSWRQGLLDGNKEIEGLVFALAARRDGNVQALRALLAIAQKELRGSEGSMESSDSGSSEDLMRPMKKTKRLKSKHGKVLLRDLRALVEMRDAEAAGAAGEE
eukprot:CAMPEP_0117656526 /NCGR_PEP_ID=MMETSP0804-20121206/4852_1 /TAXON_ID=1074897 /ORGANISM="Tetraselmis astigmatica, Strain CCMP880" /LENGTH=269 /DNA_ID=CAMNT_0005462935 /DNA_START=330 /DNA_END=1139 /DNA_ORIENTATION=+